MELDELKEAWVALDNRLKRKEDLKGKIIVDMMKKKTGKLVNRVIVMETVAIVVAFLALLYCIFLMYRSQGLIENIFALFFVTVCFFHFFWGSIKIRGLVKINLSNNVGSNFYYMNRYSIHLKHERKIYLYFVLIPSILLMITATIIELISFWWLYIGFLPALYWTHLLGTSNYHKNIGLIIKSLDEIRELKEE